MYERNHEKELHLFGNYIIFVDTTKRFVAKYLKNDQIFSFVRVCSQDEPYFWGGHSNLLVPRLS